MERIGNVKVMCRATPVVRAWVKAKTIYQSGFVGQLERRWQGIGVVASVETIVVVNQPGECFLVGGTGLQLQQLCSVRSEKYKRKKT